MSHDSNKDYRIAIAKHPEELDAVYRLRYQVFFEEGGDDRYADHELKHWRDEDDGPESTVVAAWAKEGTAVATTRLTCLKHRKFIGHSVFRFDLLADQLQRTEAELLDSVARADRGAVMASHRGKGLARLCQNAIEEIAMSYRCDILVAAQGVDNIRARRAYAKAGWCEYPVIATFRGFTGQLIYKRLGKGSP